MPTSGTSTEQGHVLRSYEALRATYNMFSFKYFFWSALFGGVIGVALGAMLTFQVFDDQRHEHDDEDEEVLHPAADMRLQQERSSDYPGESLSNTITYLKIESFNFTWVSFLLFSYTFLFQNYISTDATTLYTLAENFFQ